jgi:hypothetical protein
MGSLAPYFPAQACVDSVHYTRYVVEWDSSSTLVRQTLTQSQFLRREWDWRKRGIHVRVLETGKAFLVTRPPVRANTVPESLYKLRLPVLSNAYSGRETYRAVVQRAFSGGFLVITAWHERNSYFIESQVFDRVRSTRSNDGPNGSAYGLKEQHRDRLKRAEFEQIRRIWQERRITDRSAFGWHDGERSILDDGAHWLLETHLPEGYHFIWRSHSDAGSDAGAVKAAGRELMLAAGAGGVWL